MEQTVAPQAPPYVVDIETAASILKSAERILVIGCSGGGKSTLSQKIGERFGLVYVSLDRDVRWLPGWAERDEIERKRIIVEKAQEERWIMDGTNTTTFDLRLPRTDLVIWVRMPRLLCLWGAVSRWFKWIGRTRPEMAPGCPEKIEWQFLRFIWTFEQVYSPRIIAGLAEHGPDIPVLQLTSRRQMHALLDIFD
ncbi:AAA family ATPase [Rhizobium sp. ICMP 5592]|nr:AAA family ATPase [Rhizobium sp. ICMP 5592]